MKIAKMLIMLFCCMSINLYAAEQYEIVVTLKYKNNYAVQGKYITIKTLNCDFDHPKDQHIL